MTNPTSSPRPEQVPVSPSPVGESTLSIWLKAIPGVVFMFLIACLAHGTKDLGIPQWEGLASWIKENWSWAATYLHLNQVIIVILVGILIRNTIGIPTWAANGVRTSRLFIKMGVILLGSLYSLRELATLGATAITLILIFVMATCLFIMWWGNRIGMHPATSACMAAGIGVCGVSAAVATAPAVKAKSEDVAFAVATLLAFGVFCLFVFPPLGTLLGLSPHQFGAWAGTGIVNSGQVLAASLAFDPGTVDHPSVALKTGEIFNLTRVVFLPFVVFTLALIYTRQAVKQGLEHEKGESRGLSWIWSKFPVFVLGFLGMVALTSFGTFGATRPPSEELKLFRVLYTWFFTIGLTGLGMQISIAEMRKAGGKPLIVGFSAGALKAILALIVVLLFVGEDPPAH